MFLLAMLIIFGVEDILEFLMMVVISTSCAILSATVAWNYCLIHNWACVSINMSGTFYGEVVIISTILGKGNWLWEIMSNTYKIPIFTLPCILLIRIVNYLLLRKNLSD